MNKGYWLRRSNCIRATGKTPAQWNTIESTFVFRMNKKTRQFFVPQSYCTQQFKQMNIPVEYKAPVRDEQDILDQLQNNVDFTDQTQLQNLNVQLKKARKDKILKQTKLIGQRLLQRKRELFYQWSEKFFIAFANHFGKLKNNIVQLHLNEEQVNKFNQILDSCLNNLQCNLDEIYNQFKEQKQEKE